MRNKGSIRAAMLCLSEQVVREIREHGARDYPHETCGAMLGLDGEQGREVRSLYPLVNRRDDSPRNRFAITADDFRAAEKAAQDNNLELVGWYHSHPDHPAKPSDFDREHAWPAYAYLVLEVRDGLPAELGAFELSEDRAAFLVVPWSEVP